MEFFIAYAINDITIIGKNCVIFNVLNNSILIEMS